VPPLSQGRRRDTSRKGRRSRSPSLRGLKEPGFSCSHVVVQLQKSVGDVWSRISSANALQKERQGRVNGGLARSEGRRVKPSAVTSSEVNVVSRPHRLKTGEDRREGPGWREIVIQRLSHRQKRCGSRGTGAVMATGSYEGSLSIEGIPDHHEASAFTRRRSRWSWRSPHFPTRAKPPKRRTHGQVAAGAKAAEARR